MPRNSKKNTLMDLLLVVDHPLDAFGIRNEINLKYFIEDIERTIRTNRYYKAWVYLMKARYEQSKDVFTGYDTYEYQLSLEIHHVIFLYDIVYITGLKMISELNTEKDECLTVYQIADQVIRDHFDGIIPIVPMLKSFHEMYHEGLKQFSKEDIFGDYQAWLDKYSVYIDDYNMSKFKLNLLID